MRALKWWLLREVMVYGGMTAWFAGKLTAANVIATATRHADEAYPRLPRRDRHAERLQRAAEIGLALQHPRPPKPAPWGNGYASQSVNGWSQCSHCYAWTSDGRCYDCRYVLHDIKTQSPPADMAEWRARQIEKWGRS